jgi:hypothetical protein
MTMLGSYLLLRRLGASVDETKTMETVIFCFIGWRVIAAVERPLRGWRLGLVLGMMGLLVLQFVVPYGRAFFALDLPSWTVAGTTAGCCLFAWLFVGLGWRIGARLPFWREAAARAAEQG